jgi:hypothetical protein
MIPNVKHSFQNPEEMRYPCSLQRTEIARLYQYIRACFRVVDWLERMLLAVVPAQRNLHTRHCATVCASFRHTEQQTPLITAK